MNIKPPEETVTFEYICIHESRLVATHTTHTQTQGLHIHVLVHVHVHVDLGDSCLVDMCIATPCAVKQVVYVVYTCIQVMQTSL